MMELMMLGVAWRMDGFSGREIWRRELMLQAKALARPYGHDAGKGRTKGLAQWFKRFIV